MFSIIVSSRNRPELIIRCLESLAKQVNSYYEVVVVDQGDFPASIPDDPRFRCVVDQKRGLAAGRNAGVRAAVGSVLIFIDDDAQAGAGYLAAIEKVFNEDPRLAALAGRILTLEDGQPYTRVHGSENRFLSCRDWPRFMGGNFAVRREVIADIGPFDERFGVGRRWASGEETDFFFRMLYRRYRVAYVPAAVVRHPKEKLENVSFEQRFKLFAYARGQGALFAHHIIYYRKIRLVVTLAWWVTKPFIRMLQYFFTLQLHRGLLHGAIALGKCAGFFEYFYMLFRELITGW